jgi:putative membrane protein
MAWLRFAVITHVQALTLGEQEILLGQAPDVKQLAVKAQPILRHHLEQALAAWEKCTATGFTAPQVD